MTEPQIVCPNCRTGIKLTESLAASLIAETRRRLEEQIAAREADFGKREAALKQLQDDVTKTRETIDEQVATKLKTERADIAEAETKKARVWDTSISYACRANTISKIAYSDWIALSKAVVLRDA